MKFKYLEREKISQLPKEPGVYCFKEDKKILYVGKAANIKERVKNHFPSRSEGERRTNVLRTQQPGYRNYLFLNKTKKIGYIKTNSEIEALILEANLIKKYQPKYNVVWRDDKNYFFVAITKEDFPRIFWTHQTKLKPKTYNLKPKFVGPFVDGKAIKQTLKILREVFPFRSCNKIPKKPCLWYHLSRCPAPCLIKTKLVKEIPKIEMKMKEECQKNAKNIIEIFKKGEIKVLNNLKKEMKRASTIQDFERAAKIRDQIEVFEKILANAKIFGTQLTPTDWQKIQEILKGILKSKKGISRIEAYDISNIQGRLATGAMITFIEGRPDKNFYRKFKIHPVEFVSQQFNRVKITSKPNDIAMIKEVLNRRFKHSEWPYPDLILIDGGKAQLNAAIKIKNQYKPALINVLALAKKENKLFIEGRKNPILLKNLPREIFNLILQLRDEAHRFAISYHRKLREKGLFELT